MESTPGLFGHNDNTVMPSFCARSSSSRSDYIVLEELLKNSVCVFGRDLLNGKKRELRRSYRGLALALCQKKKRVDSFASPEYVNKIVAYD